MTYFNEENTVEQLVLDTLRGIVPGNIAAEESVDYGGVGAKDFSPLRDVACVKKFL